MKQIFKNPFKLLSGWLPPQRDYLWQPIEEISTPPPPPERRSPISEGATPPEQLAGELMEQMLGREAIMLLTVRDYQNLRYGLARNLENWLLAHSQERICILCNNCLTEK